MVFVLVSLALLLSLYVAANQSIFLPQLSLKRIAGDIRADGEWDAALAQLRPQIGDAMLSATGDETSTLPLDGTPERIVVAGEVLWFSAQDVGGLVDLNMASPLLMRAFLERLDPSKSGARFEALTERRAQGPIQDIGEVLELWGIAEADAPAVARRLTVASGSAFLNPETVSHDLTELFGFEDKDAFVAAHGARYFRRAKIRRVVIEKAVPQDEF